MTMIESPSRIEPCLLDDVSIEIADLATELSGQTSKLGSRLHARSAASLADAVRIMNCYYSNLIEGHETKPRDIERAMNHDFDSGEKRNLQLEAQAHMRIQQAIDQAHQAGTLPEPASEAFLHSLHHDFFVGMPEEHLYVVAGERRIRIKPGAYRHGAVQDVTVGRHHPPSSDAVPAFMAHFSSRYRIAPLRKVERILAMAASHHRLNHIHPFLDGNGRVSRLMSHAIGLQAGIGAHGLWSVSRGLARGLNSRAEYKSMMDRADMPRQGDLDGRGNLSRKALAEFVTWFLRVCLDQVSFMATMFELETLLDRLHTYVTIRQFRPETFFILQYVLQLGEMARGDAARITGLGERPARDALSALTRDGILASETPKGPVSLRFPLATVEVLFPTLFPQS